MDQGVDGRIALRKVDQQRLAIGNLAIEWCAVLIEVFKARHAEVDWNRINVEWCVIVGHFEGRPMNASKIAETIALPRTTVMRMLKELETAGIVRKTKQSTYCLSHERARCSTAVAQLARLVLKAAADLSNLDR